MHPETRKTYKETEWNKAKIIDGKNYKDPAEGAPPNTGRCCFDMKEETFRISRLTDTMNFKRLVCEHWGLKEHKSFKLYDDLGE